MFREFFYSLGPGAAWLAFFICLLIIFVTGTRLSRYGDLIGVRTGLGGAWVGLVVLAAVTSMPELVTGLSSILVVGEPDLAVGSALGSCVYNLIIIAILDFLYRPGTIYTGIQRSHSLSAGFGVVLLGAVAAALFIQGHVTPISIGVIGPFSIIAPVLYFFAMRSVFFFERREENGEYVAKLTEARKLAGVSAAGGLGWIYLVFAANAVVLIAAAMMLPVIGEALALAMGWNETFVGTIFLALVTSVPEIVISVEAVRIGAVDLAIGGLLGSNLFDLVIVAVGDIAYVDGPILAAVSSQHLLTAIAALTMTGIAIVGLCSRPKAHVFRIMGWASLGLLTVGLFSGLVLYLMS